jgi:hypothetical protein
MSPSLATDHAQRAGIGLIVTEGISPSPNGLGFCGLRGRGSITFLRLFAASRR